MTSKERMECVFSGIQPDHYPCFDSFWGEAVDRWHNEGLPADAHPHNYFDFDMDGYGVFDLSAQLPVEFISEDDTYKIIKDSRGIVAKHHKNESGHTPQWLEMPIKTPSDWWTYKERLVFNEDRINKDVFEWVKGSRERNKWTALFHCEAYEQAWPVFGQVQIFMAMLENPEIVKDAMDTWTDLTIQCFEYCISRGLDFDGAFFYGDMGYRNGTLFGPDVYRELIMPAHKKLVNYVHDNNKKVILHSCGQIKSFIPMLIEVGFDALQPLEAKCGQDGRELQKEYGRQIVFFGNMDIRALSSTKEAVKEEIESKLAAFDGNWNYIYHSDHSIPQTVSFENYSYAIELVKNYFKR